MKSRIRIAADAPPADRAADAVRWLLDAIRTHAAPAARADRRRFQDAIYKTANSIQPSLSAESWQQLMQAAEQELERYAGLVGAHQRAAEQRARTLVAGLCVAAEVLAPAQGAFAVRFRDLTRKLRLLASRNDLAALAAQVERDLAALEKAALQLPSPEAPALALERLSAAMGHDRTPLAAEAADPVTGLPDRFEAAAAYGRRLEASLEFSVLVARIERFPAFAGRRTEETAQLVMRHFARRLEACRPAAADLFAWSGGVLIALAPGAPNAWEDRCEEWEEALSGVYHVREGTQPVQFPVQARICLAAAAGGQDLAAVVERALLTRLERIARLS